MTTTSATDLEVDILRARVEALERTVSALVAAHRASLHQSAKAKAVDDRILLAVSDEFAVSAAAIMSRRREAHVAIARHVAIYLTRKWLGLSYPVLAQQFGHRDHTSAMHSDHLVHRRRQVDDGFALRVARIEAEINTEAEREQRAS
jgi:chromosomal replication initiator protein